MDIEDISHSFGITLETGDDFRIYKAIIAAERTAQSIAPPFDIGKLQIKPQDGFWIIGRTAEGALIYTQAYRLTPNGTQSLAEYLTEKFRDFPPVLPDIDLPGSSYTPTPAASRMTGRIMYAGDAWLAPEATGRGLFSLLNRATLYRTVDSFDPDWIFGFIARPLAEKGFAERIGYFHCEPGALQWRREGQDGPLEGFMCHMHRSDIAHLRALR